MLLSTDSATILFQWTGVRDCENRVVGDCCAEWFVGCGWLLGLLLMRLLKVAGQ